MSQFFQPIIGFWFIAPARSNEQFITLQGLARSRNEGKTLFFADDLIHPGARENFYAVSFTGGQKTINDGLRIIALRENSTIRFAFKLYSPFFKPTYRILGAEFGKGLDEFFMAAGIMFDELARFLAAIGDIAAAPAGYFYFGQKFGRLFQNRHPNFGIVGRHIGCRKNPCRPGSYDDDVTVFHCLLLFPV